MANEDMLRGLLTWQCGSGGRWSCVGGCCFPVYCHQPPSDLESNLELHWDRAQQSIHIWTQIIFPPKFSFRDPSGSLFSPQFWQHVFHSFTISSQTTTFDCPLQMLEIHKASFFFLGYLSGKTQTLQTQKCLFSFSEKREMELSAIIFPLCFSRF